MQSARTHAFYLGRPRRSLAFALAIAGLSAPAYADGLSLDSLKEMPSLTAAGVTIYGTVDVGGSWQSNGAPQSSYLYTGGLDWNMYGSRQNRESVGAFTGSALSQSQIGIKVEESLGMGFTAIAKADTGFNPWSGELADACQSLVHNNGRPAYVWNSALDGSRCGQAFNGQVYGGLSNAEFGTLTFGRQNSFNNDMVGSYDPLAGSYALSLIGFSGGAFAGIGSTETARWDNSVKYIYQYGPAHAGVMYANGADGSSIQGHAWGANAGFGWRGFSVDGVYTSEKGAVNMSTIGYAIGNSPADGTCSFYGGGNFCPSGDWLNATITDNEAWAVVAKYVYQFGGGLKDEGPGDKLTFFGGYNHTTMSNPDTTVLPGSSTIGGYQMWTVNNQPYGLGSDRVLETSWAGARYDTGSWAFTAAYYHISQNSYVAHALGSAPGAGLTYPTAADCAKRPGTLLTGYQQKGNCSGDSNTVSGLVDYTFNKHADVYAGVSWTDVSGGFASGFVGGLDNTTVVSGLRLKF